MIRLILACALIAFLAGYFMTLLPDAMHAETVNQRLAAMKVMPRSTYNEYQAFVEKNDDY